MSLLQITAEEVSDNKQMLELQFSAKGLDKKVYSYALLNALTLYFDALCRISWASLTPTLSLPGRILTVATQLFIRYQYVHLAICDVPVKFHTPIHLFPPSLPLSVPPLLSSLPPSLPLSPSLPPYLPPPSFFPTFPPSLPPSLRPMYSLFGTLSTLTGQRSMSSLVGCVAVMHHAAFVSSALTGTMRLLLISLVNSTPAWPR